MRYLNFFLGDLENLEVLYDLKMKYCHYVGVMPVDFEMIGVVVLDTIRKEGTEKRAGELEGKLEC